MYYTDAVTSLGGSGFVQGSYGFSNSGFNTYSGDYPNYLGPLMNAIAESIASYENPT